MSEKKRVKVKKDTVPEAKVPVPQADTQGIEIPVEEPVLEAEESVPEVEQFVAEIAEELSEDGGEEGEDTKSEPEVVHKELPTKFRIGAIVMGFVDYFQENPVWVIGKVVDIATYPGEVSVYSLEPYAKTAGYALLRAPMYAGETELYPFDPNVGLKVNSIVKRAQLLNRASELQFSRAVILLRDSQEA